MSGDLLNELDALDGATNIVQTPKQKILDSGKRKKGSNLEKISINVDKSLLKQIDDWCEGKPYTRTQILVVGGLREFERLKKELGE